MYQQVAALNPILQLLIQEHNMSLYDDIVKAYPELKDYSFSHKSDIMLRDDSDGVGEYIAIWKYDKPIPDGLKLGKPKL